jgi:hypothetical protein
MTRKTHKQVEFSVDDGGGRERIFHAFDEAVGFAVSLAASDGNPRNVDVLIYGESGARWWGGEEGVESYLEDPDASVSERIVIRAESVGRIP